MLPYWNFNNINSTFPNKGKKTSFSISYVALFQQSFVSEMFLILGYHISNTIWYLLQWYCSFFGNVSFFLIILLHSIFATFNSFQIKIICTHCEHFVLFYLFDRICHSQHLHVLGIKYHLIVFKYTLISYIFKLNFLAIMP